MKLKKQSLKQFQLLFILFTVSDCQHYNSLVSSVDNLTPYKAQGCCSVDNLTPYKTQGCCSVDKHYNSLVSCMMPVTTFSTLWPVLHVFRIS
jgi:hypothetical protein